MSLKTILLGISAVAAIALPGVASAQSYGYGYGYGQYGAQRHDGRSSYRDRGYDRGDRYRYEQRRRWEWARRHHRHHDRNEWRGDYRR